MTKDMTMGKEWRVILFFALPILFGNLIQHLYTIVDGIIIGQVVGEEALSAVGTSFSLIILFLAFAIGLSVGSGILIAQNFGAKRFEQLRVVVSTSLLLMTGLGALISALAALLAPFFLRHVLGVPDTLFDMALTYFQLFSIGIVFQFIFNGVVAVLRAVGDAKVTLYFLIITSILNVILTLLAVVILGWGIAGAAWTTVISKFASAVMAYVYMVRKYAYLRPEWRFDFLICRLILKLGLPLSLQNGMASLAFMAMGRLVNSFGIISIASYTVATRIDGFALMPLLAFNNSMTTFTGQNIGANRLDRVKAGFVQTLIMTLISSLVFMAVLMAFAPAIAQFFGLEGETLTRAVTQIRFVTPFYVLIVPFLVIGGMLKGAGDVVFPMLAISAELALRVVLAYLLVHFGVLGYNAAWVTIPIGWALLLVLGMIRLRSGKWKTKSLIKR